MNIKPINAQFSFVWITRRCNAIIAFYIFLPCLISSASDNYPAGSRAAALGGAGVMSSDLWSGYHNQAGLGFYSHLSAGAHHENMFLVPEFGLSSLALCIPTGTGTFSINYSYFGYSAYNESKAGLGFGKALNEIISAGIQFDYLHTYIADETGNHRAFALEAGILAKPARNLTIGFHVFNPTHSKYIKRPDNEHIPMIFTLGAGYSYREFLFVCFETEKNLERGPVLYKGGIEYRIIPSLYARAGVNVGEFISHSFGLGIVFKKIRGDLAFSRHHVLGYTPHISLQYTIK